MSTGGMMRIRWEGQHVLGKASSWFACLCLYPADGKRGHQGGEPHAVLNANYLAAKLGQRISIPYTEALHA